MAAYIIVRELLADEVPSCGDPECDQMEHQNRVEIGPAILGPLEAMLGALRSVVGPGPIKYGSCAKAIKRGEKMLKAVKGKAL